MSELRVALVAEGPTDRTIIESALKAVLGAPFVLTVLQPEATRPVMGGGWCGVFKWCRDFAARASASLEEDPILENFDLFILHLDADVAEMAYEDGGAAVVGASQGLLPLPCSRPCPPPSDAVDGIRKRLINWLGVATVGPRTVLCVPSKSSEAWLAAAVLPTDHAVLAGIECDLHPEARLGQLPKDQRIQKSRRAYQEHAPTTKSQWPRVEAACSQALRFRNDVQAATLSDVPAQG
jgi:hypothetical protein